MTITKWLGVAAILILCFLSPPGVFAQTPAPPNAKIELGPPTPTETRGLGWLPTPKKPAKRSLWSLLKQTQINIDDRERAQQKQQQNMSAAAAIASHAAAAAASAARDSDSADVPIATRAKDGLGRFLERKDPGFDLKSIGVFATDLQTFTHETRLRLSSLRAGSQTLRGLLRQSMPIQLILLLIGGLWWMDRRAQEVRQSVWELLPPITYRVIDHFLDSLLRVLAKTIPLMLLLLPVYVPLHGLFPGEMWLSLLTEVLWILLIYRAFKTTANELLMGDILDLPQKPLGLRRWFERGLKSAMIIWTAAQIVRILGYHPEVYALLDFCLKIFIAAHALRLLGLRDELTYFFPETTDNPTYRVIRSNLQLLLRFVVGLSFILMLLWAFGYETAATLILVRAYSLIGVAIGSVVLYQKGNHFIRALIRAQETADHEPIDRERHQVLTSLERSSFTLGVWALGWMILNLLGLWPLIVEVTSYGLLSLGKVEINIYVVARGLFILLFFIFTSRLIRAVLNENIYERFAVDVGVGYAINTMVHYFLFFIGMMLSVSSVGIDLTAISIFFSALGIGIGIGLQGIVNNLLSGLILLFGRSVKKGDYVTINDQYGRVDAVGARSVTITTPDNFEVIIPSSDLISNSIINWTLTSPLIRMKIPIGVSYDSDVRQVKELLLQAASRHPRVLRRPQPEIWLTGFGDSSVDFGLLVYIDCRSTNPTRVTGELNYHIWDTLSEANIEIPFPQQDLHIRSGLEPLTAHVASDGTLQREQ